MIEDVKRDTKIYKTLNNYKKELEKLGYNVIYIGLYGSQNYNLDDEESDVDAKVVVIPTFNDYIDKKVISKYHKFDTGECDVKDILTFFEQIRKGNIAYCESVHTNYYIGDKELREYFKKFKYTRKSLYGQMLDKYNALTHLYPSKVEIIKKFGFDPKQAHHILRLHDIALTNDEFHPFIVYNDMPRMFMLSLKRNSCNLTLDVVDQGSMKRIKYIKEKLKDYEFKQIEDDGSFVKNYIKKSLKKELYSDDVHSVREFRTFDNPIPQNDLNNFPILEKYKNKDIRYTIYSNIEIEE